MKRSQEHLSDVPWMDKETYDNSYLIRVLLECSSNIHEKKTKVLSSMLESGDKYATILINKESFCTFVDSICSKDFTKLFNINIENQNLPSLNNPEILLNFPKFDSTFDTDLIELTKKIITEHQSAEQLSTIYSETGEAKPEFKFQFSSLSTDELQHSNDFEQPVEHPNKRIKLQE